MQAQIPVSEQLPLSVEEIVLNIERQAREFALESIAIPELRFRQEIALSPITTKQKTVSDLLKANAAARAKAPVKELGKIRKDELELLIQANDLKEVKKQKRAELGIATQISSAKAAVDAHKWRRYEQLQKAGVKPNADPLPREDEDMEAHKAFKAANKLFQKLKQQSI